LDEAPDRREPPRVSGRLLTLRRWRHDEDLIEIFA